MRRFLASLASIVASVVGAHASAAETPTERTIVSSTPGASHMPHTTHSDISVDSEGKNNQYQIEQDPNAGSVKLKQRGEDNHANVQQSGGVGSGNKVSISQSGSGNKVSVVQSGGGNSSVIITQE